MACLSEGTSDHWEQQNGFLSVRPEAAGQRILDQQEQLHADRDKEGITGTGTGSVGANLSRQGSMMEQVVHRSVDWLQYQGNFSRKYLAVRPFATGV